MGESLVLSEFVLSLTGMWHCSVNTATLSCDALYIMLTVQADKSDSRS